MEKQEQNDKTLLDRARYIGRVVHISRKTINISLVELAGHLGITVSDLEQYEQGQRQIPRSILLELFMFGMARWSRR